MPHPLLENGPVYEPEQVDENALLHEEIDALRDEVADLRKNYERDRAQWAGILGVFQSAFGGRTTAPPEADGAPMPQSTTAW